MDAVELARIIADYLDNRDDIAHAESHGVDINIKTQGGIWYEITVVSV